MKFKIVTALAAMTLATAAYADSAGGGGDATKGEKVFRKCRSCHSIVADNGDVIVKGGRTGPNLYGVIGRTAGTYDDFKYKKGIVAAGEKGLVWDEESFVTYVQDPSEFLEEYLDDKSIRSGMTFKLRKGMEDVYAYLVSVGPDMSGDAASTN